MASDDADDAHHHHHNHSLLGSAVKLHERIHSQLRSTELDIPHLSDLNPLSSSSSSSSAIPPEPQPPVYIVPPPKRPPPVPAATTEPSKSSMLLPSTPPSTSKSSDSLVDQLAELQRQMYIDTGLAPPERPQPGFALAAGGLSRQSFASALEGPGSESSAAIDRLADGSSRQTLVPRWRKLDADVVPPNVDSYYLPSFLVPESIADTLVRQFMLNELDWTTMTHNGGKVPRLVCVQAEFVDGWYPIYRHPVDAPAPPTHELSTSVRLLKASLESATNQKFNHVLIQQYRSGEDCISQHADKTLDLVPGSKIVNVSLGAMRYMSLKKKRDSLRARSASSSTLPKRKINFVRAHITNGASIYRSIGSDQESEAGDSDDEAYSDDEHPHPHQQQQPPTTSPTPVTFSLDNYDKHPKNAISRPPAPNQRIALEHNSIFVLGAHTNKLWTHQIKPDKRARAQKSPAELAFDGFRVSLTFRSVATFVTNSSSSSGNSSSSGRPQLIYGRGATAKDRVHASPVLYSDSSVSESDRENARAQAKKLLGAFAAENRLGESFDWQRAYGQGFDIVDFPTDL